MNYTPLASKVFVAIQGSRDPQGKIWLTYVLRSLCQLSEPESAILRALHDNDVWGIYERSKFLEVAAAQHAKGEHLEHDAEILLGQLFTTASDYAEREGSREICELHLAQALVEMGEVIFRYYQLRGARLVNAVRRLETLKERNCFVLMPLAHRFNLVYTEGIKPWVEAVGLKCARADENPRPGFVFGHIEESIRGASVIVADLTGLNTNVVLELGVAWGCRKPTVLVSQDPLGALPFDLRPFRAMQYEATTIGLSPLREWLKRSLAEVVQPGRIVGAMVAAQAPVGELRIPLVQIQSLIAPKLAAEGYDVAYVSPQDAERFRKGQWEDVIWFNDKREPCRLYTTENHAVLRRRNN